MFLSVDFEDFNHDLKFKLGGGKDLPLKINDLWEKYYLIHDFLNKNATNNGRYITFFCTAVLAEKAPDLIHKISKDGHEIACHYYHHDIMENQPISKVERTLSVAKSLLEDASQTKVVGFRAPNFRINKINAEQYLAVEKLFHYDSSYFCSSKDALSKFKNKMGLTNLRLFPVFAKGLADINLKLGGSSLKIFPLWYSRLFARKAEEIGFTPHIYLHPYEFGPSDEFRVSRESMHKLGLGVLRSVYWEYRQSQWLTLRNKSTLGKLEYLLRNYELKGRLRDNLDRVFI
jgi:peptidoglycan/xylan/chitin deacetylase (PgdA/CDA1 family)